MQTHSTRTLAISALLLAYPALLFAFKGGMNGAFFLLVALGLIGLFQQRRAHPKHFDNDAIAFTAAMSLSMVAIFASQAYHGHFDPHPYDGASRFLLAVPVYLALRRARIGTLGMLQYGLPIGALGALLVVLLAQGNFYYVGRASSAYMHPIYFGDLALIIGLLSLFSINLTGRDKPAAIALKAAGCLASLYVSILSQSRGGWMAIPVLLTAWLLMHNSRHRYFKLSYAVPLMLLAMLASYFMVDFIHNRIDLIFTELADFSHGQADSSVGIRLQLWKAALHLFAENPLFGVGPDGFAAAATSLSQSGFITREAARLGQGEVHSQILAYMAGLGIPGLVAILSLYFAPMWLGWRAARSGVASGRIAGQMVVCLTLGFFIFGLTVETFNIKMIVSFYSLTLAVLLAIAHHDGEQAG